MHFAIPDTMELRNGAGGSAPSDGAKSFTVYNVHINGAFHCALRYRQLYRLHEQLKKDLSEFTQLPSFPPRKIFALSAKEKEERRVQLERYIQKVSQNVYVCRDSRLRSFLLLAQMETFESYPFHSSPSSSSSSSRFAVHLLNGAVISLEDVAASDSASDVRDKLAKALRLPEALAPYFALFLVALEDPSGGGGGVAGGGPASASVAFPHLSILRHLQDFESPVLSLRAAAMQHAASEAAFRVVFRRCYWETEVEETLLEDPVATELLFIEVISDVERGWILPTDEQLEEIEAMRRRGAKREALILARRCKYYGYVHFRPCLMDYPAPGTRAFVAAGNQELNFRMITGEGGIKEGGLKVTRMRCWRMMTSTTTTESTSDDGRESTTNGSEVDSDDGGGGGGVCVVAAGDHSHFGRNGFRPDSEVSSTCSSNLSCSSVSELSIEYLVAKDTLRWITLASDQAVSMSMCLQGMVDHLMQKRETGSAKWMNRRSSSVKRRLNAGFYMRRDGTTLFDSPLTRTLAESLEGGVGDSGVDDGHFDGAGDPGGGGAVSLARSEEPRAPNLADRVQRVVAGRVPRSASELSANSINGGVASGCGAVNGFPGAGKRMSSSKTAPPNGFSMAYRNPAAVAAVAENHAFDGIREDDL